VQIDRAGQGDSQRQIDLLARTRRQRAWLAVSATAIGKIGKELLNVGATQL
jgi:hypothetical protein